MAGERGKGCSDRNRRSVPIVESICQTRTSVKTKAYTLEGLPLLHSLSPVWVVLTLDARILSDGPLSGAGIL